MKKSFKYRLYPTMKQTALLQWTLDRVRELYNASLEERREAYRMSKVTITYNQQANQLPEMKEIRPEYKDIHSQVLQDTLRRVEKAMRAFFRRVENGEKAGYPRFKSFNRFDQTGAYLPNGAAAKAGLNKSILDAGWYQFQQYCLYKAESAGRDVLLVHPKLTSQVCSGCGQIVRKDLSERWHSCECGAELDRDYNAAINILRLGSSQRKPLRVHSAVGTA
jgi:transposase